MPITTSAKKAVRQTIAKTQVNAFFKKAMKNNIKTANKSIEKKEEKKAIVSAIQAAQKSIDKASKRNIISKKSASRKISSLMKKMNSSEK